MTRYSATVRVSKLRQARERTSHVQEKRVGLVGSVGSFIYSPLSTDI